jgi:hypothetical protein
MFKALGTFLRWIFTPFIAIVLLFEEWGWAPLAAWVARLAQMPVWARAERRIAQLPPWGALLVLGMPTLALLPIKLMALYFLGVGQAAIGVTVLVAAKVVGTALLARLFQITQPALMQLAWFARWYPRWKAWKDALLSRIRASAVWHTGRSIKSALRRSVRALLRKANK